MKAKINFGSHAAGKRMTTNLRSLPTRIKGPNGEWLHLVVVHVVDRDEKGRVKNFRAYYDDMKVDLQGMIDEKGPGYVPEFYTVWMTGLQLHGGKEAP